MWDVVGMILEKFGLATAISLGVIGAGGYALRALWQRNIVLEVEVAKAASDVHVRLLKLQAEHNEFVQHLRIDHERSIREARETMLESAATFSDRMDALHEKRNVEMREALREAVEHIADTRVSVDKITDAVQSLRDLIRR